jgi:hypothetical protein
MLRATAPSARGRSCIAVESGNPRGLLRDWQSRARGIRRERPHIRVSRAGQWPERPIQTDHSGESRSVRLGRGLSGNCHAMFLPDTFAQEMLILRHKSHPARRLWLASRSRLCRRPARRLTARVKLGDEARAGKGGDVKRACTTSVGIEKRGPEGYKTETRSIWSMEGQPPTLPTSSHSSTA